MVADFVSVVCASALWTRYPAPNDMTKPHMLGLAVQPDNACRAVGVGNAKCIIAKCVRSQANCRSFAPPFRRQPLWTLAPLNDVLCSPPPELPGYASGCCVNDHDRFGVFKQFERTIVKAQLALIDR